MSESKQKQVHLGSLGITVAVLYSEVSSLCRVGVAVMSPIDRMAKQIMSPDGVDPWSMVLGSRIALGRAEERGRRRTMLRGALPDTAVDHLLEKLVSEDAALKCLLTIAKQNPSEQLFARMAGVARALRHVRSYAIPVGRTWDRRITLAFAGTVPAVTLQHEEVSAGGSAG